VSTAAETAGSPHIDRESLKPVVPSVTASNGWRADELSTIDGCGEVDIATRRSDGTLRAARIMWIVRHGNAVYVRSVNGTTAALVPRRPDLPRGRAERWTTPDHLNDEKDTTWTRTPAAPR